MSSPSNPNSDNSDDFVSRSTLDKSESRFENSIHAQQTHELARSRQDTALSDKQQRSLITYNHLTYLLYVIGYLTVGLSWIVSIAMNYAKRHDADGTWLATHFDWQIKTFWYSIIWFVIGLIITLVAVGGLGISVLAESNNLAIGSGLFTGLGILIILFTVIWHVYRIARGWIALSDKRPVP